MGLSPAAVGGVGLTGPAGSVAAAAPGVGSGPAVSGTPTGRRAGTGR